MPVIQAKDLGFTYPYDPSPVISGISFSAEEGEEAEIFLGYGKTTLCRIIGGLLVPSEGEIFLRGENLFSVPKEKRNIAVIFDDYALTKGSVRENLAFGLKVRGYDKNEIIRITEIQAEKFGLTDKLKVRTKKLSRKDAFTTALARADARKIDLLVLDDVFRGMTGEEEALAKKALQTVKSAQGCAVIKISDKGEKDE